MNNQFGKKVTMQFRGKPWEILKKKIAFSALMKEGVMSFIMSCTDIRKVICGGCSVQRLYDKNGKIYGITRNHTLDEVKQIVEEIRKVNAA